MYSLLVTLAASERSEGSFEIDRSRFLEYTAEGIAIQLRSLSIEARACIRSWPCILAQEGKGQEEARLVEITHIDATRAEVRVKLAALPCRWCSSTTLFGKCARPSISRISSSIATTGQSRTETSS